MKKFAAILTLSALALGCAEPAAPPAGSSAPPAQSHVAPGAAHQGEMTNEQPAVDTTTPEATPPAGETSTPAETPAPANP